MTALSETEKTWVKIAEETGVEITYKEVAEHTTKKDLWMVIKDVVFDISDFVDEHPGGEEVLIESAGADATEAFDDVGHSDEAREILAIPRRIKGKLKRVAGDPAPLVNKSSSSSTSSPTGETGMGIALYAVILVGGLAAFGAYKYMQSQQVEA